MCELSLGVTNYREIKSRSITQIQPNLHIVQQHFNYSHANYILLMIQCTSKYMGAVTKAWAPLATQPS